MCLLLSFIITKTSLTYYTYIYIYINIHILGRGAGHHGPGPDDLGGGPEDGAQGLLPHVQRRVPLAEG